MSFITNSLTLLLSLLLLTTLDSAHARLIGSSPQAPDFYSPETSAVQEENAKTSDPFAGLDSEKPFEVRAAIKALATELENPQSKKNIPVERMDQILDLLSSDSENLKMIAESFVGKYAKILFDKGFLDDDKIKSLSGSVYGNPRKLAGFMVFMKALLKNGDPRSQSILTPEAAFEILEAIASENVMASKTAAEILATHTKLLIEKKVWSQIHMRDFITKFSDAPRDNQMPFFKVFEACYDDWIENGLLTSSHVLTLLVSKNVMTSDLQGEFIRLLSDAKAYPYFLKTGLYDETLAQRLVDDVTNPNSVISDRALSQITYLIRPLAQSGAMKAADFTKVWSYIFANINRFQDPFEIIEANVQALMKSGWLKRNDFEQLVLSFEKFDPYLQEKFLDFMDANYSHFANAGWVSATPLIPVLFGKTTSDIIRKKRIAIIYHHPDLVVDKALFGPDEIAAYALELRGDNADTLNQVLDTFHVGFDTWLKQGVMTKTSLLKVLEIDSSLPQCEKLLEVLKVRFNGDFKVFDKEVLLRISDFVKSPRLKISNAAIDFFEQHFETHISTDASIRQALKKNFKSSQRWEALKPLYQMRSKKKSKTAKK